MGHPITTLVLRNLPHLLHSSDTHRRVPIRVVDVGESDNARDAARRHCRKPGSAPIIGSQFTSSAPLPTHFSQAVCPLPLQVVDFGMK